MDAYLTISKIDPHNPLVMLRASDFCALFDGRLTLEDKEKLLNEVALRLRKQNGNQKSPKKVK